MKSALALLAMGIALHAPAAAGPAGPSFMQRCEKELAARYDVDWRMFGYDVDNKVSSRVLANRAAHGAAGQFVLGMTAMQTRAAIDLSAPSLTDSASGQECLAPRITVELLLPRMDVFVARELSPVSCSYRAVLDHEMQHVRIYEEALPRIAELLRARMRERYGSGPLYAPVGAGMDRLDADLDRWLRPMIQTELLRLERAQRSLDSEEESFRLSGVCGGELSVNLGARY